MPRLKLFIVEDDDWYREYLHYTLSLNPDHEVSVFNDGKGCVKHLDESPDIVTVDFGLPDMTGADLLKQIKRTCPQAEVIVISEQDKIETALQLLKDGAYDYFVKSKDIRDRLLNSISHIQEGLKIKSRLNQLEKAVKSKFDYKRSIIGDSVAMQKIFDLIEKSLHNNLTVTILGETGTGKEEVAKAIHYNSDFNKGQFVALNMAAIPKELAESELFGHEKGAFTGALTSRPGKFEEAHNGTIFLDEIGEMDLSLQVKLLRVLQEKSVTRIGSNQSIKVNNRVIVATHRNLREEVDKGNFREDLYYRIFGLTIQLPPLRERGNDVLLLAAHFIKLFCDDNKIAPKTLSSPAKEKLMSYRFPGNVRELKSLIELACVVSHESEIAAEDLHIESTSGQGSFFEDGLTLDDYTRKIIRHYLEINNGNVITTAQQLDIGKSTIYRMMKDGKV